MQKKYYIYSPLNTCEQTLHAPVNKSYNKYFCRLGCQRTTVEDGHKQSTCIICSDMNAWWWKLCLPGFWFQNWLLNDTLLRRLFFIIVRYWEKSILKIKFVRKFWTLQQGYQNKSLNQNIFQVLLTVYTLFLLA